MNVDQIVVLVTGAASGLGAASADRLHRCGARVILADVNEEGAREKALELGNGARSLRLDVTSEESAQEALENIVKTEGSLHAVINCAGILIGEKILGRDGVHDLGRFRRVIDVNLTGTFNMIRLAAQQMRQNEPNAEGERGVIVNTASIAAFEGQLGQSAYSASKAGIVGLTLPAARELAREGIRVCAIAPGIFDTAMIGGLPEKVRDALGAQVPFPSRLGKPDEYAATVQHIIENPILNGETIRLDGAMRMAAR
ncbi:MAG: SDR family NAD(P)-dependent oxidoreductase [Acidobacteriota bacterium]|nr:MAG: SDR family NAD(P)-dependent oxidoreductase [Acidobacteriota bacterium]